MIVVSDAAKTELTKLLKENGKAGIRIRVEGGGCSGLRTKLDYDNQQEGDKVTEFEGGKVFVDAKSYLYVMNSLLDYEGGLNGKGFELKVEGAQKSCGCGQSFSF